jgi:hypothetical protein
MSEDNKLDMNGLVLSQQSIIRDLTDNLAKINKEYESFKNLIEQQWYNNDNVTAFQCYGCNVWKEFEVGSFYWDDKSCNQHQIVSLNKIKYCECCSKSLPNVMRIDLFACLRCEGHHIHYLN